MPWNNQDVDIILEGKEAVYSSGEYLVPNMNQIKSAIGNTGEFSTESDNIYNQEVQRQTGEIVNAPISTIISEDNYCTINPYAFAKKYKAIILSQKVSDSYDKYLKKLEV